jgi:trigger factor
MQVSVETKEGLFREMVVEFPVSTIDGEIKSRLQKLTKTAKLNGFRSGKIPFSVVKQRFGQQVHAEVLNEALHKNYYEAIALEKINPAGQPEIDLLENENKDKVSFKATFEVVPEITIQSLSGRNLEKPSVIIVEEDIDATIENIRKQNQKYEQVEREARESDRVLVDFSGTIDGEAFKGNEGKNVPIILGQGQMIEGFENGLKGASAGDNITLDLVFPENYRLKEVAGKAVQFTIAVNAVEESVLEELNDEFFAIYGVAQGGESAFREEVKKNMQLELDKAIAARMKNEVMALILDVNDIEIPKALIEEEAKSMVKQMKSQYQLQDQAAAEIQTSLFEEQAKKRVAMGLLLADIVKNNDIKASVEQIMGKISEMAESYENPQEVIDYYKSHKDKLAEIETFILEEKVVDWAFEQANVTEKELTFSELINPKQNQNDIVSS